MNNKRQPYLTVCQLPYNVTLRFGKSGAPEEKNLNPMFRKLGSEKCLMQGLPIKKWSPKEVTVQLPESLACHGEGRYELVLHDKCCQHCDTVEIWFEADCEVVSIEGEDSEICYEC